MSGTLYAPVFGMGLGHSARMVAVANELRQHGFEVIFSSGGDAVSYLRAHGYRCVEVPVIEVGWGLSGGLALRETLGQGPIMLARFVEQVQLELGFMRRFHPDLVLADSRMSGVWAARLLDLPVLVILNQLRILLPARHRGPRIQWLESIGAQLLAWGWRRAHAILVPDLPPPYTISEQHLWGFPFHGKPIEYIGFVLPPEAWAPTDAPPFHDWFVGDGTLVFAQISGPGPTKKRLLAVAREAAADSHGLRWIISAGQPGGNSTPRAIPGGWYFEWCPWRDSLFHRADVLVLRGGHSSLAQAIIAGKPVVAVPIEDHSEQAGNAAKVARLGLGYHLAPANLTAARLAQTVTEVANDRRFHRRATELQHIARQYDGLRTVAEWAGRLMRH